MWKELRAIKVWISQLIVDNASTRDFSSLQRYSLFPQTSVYCSQAFSPRRFCTKVSTFNWAENESLPVKQDRPPSFCLYVCVRNIWD